MDAIAIGRTAHFQTPTVRRIVQAKREQLLDREVEQETVAAAIREVCSPLIGGQVRMFTSARSHLIQREKNSATQTELY